MSFSPNLRYHAPDLADMSAEGLSETTFQIPSSLGSTSQLLLDDCDDFFAGMDPTLSTPAPPSMKPWNDAPLTLADLTPRSKRTQAARKYIPSTSSRKPTISSPLKSAVAHGLSTAMEDSLSPIKPRPDLSFEIPQMSNNITQLLASGDDHYVLGKDSEHSFPSGASITPLAPHNLLTLSQLASDSTPNTSDSSFSEGPSTPKLSQLSLVNTPSALQAQMTDPGNHDIALTPLFCQGSSNTNAPHEAATDNSVDDPHAISPDEITRPTSGSEGPAGTPEIPAQQATIQPVHTSHYRKSTGKQTVIAGGVVAKRSKQKLLTSTNSLRSKAIGKRKAVAQSVLRSRVAGEGPVARSRFTGRVVTQSEGVSMKIRAAGLSARTKPLSSRELHVTTASHPFPADIMSVSTATDTQAGLSGDSQSATKPTSKDWTAAQPACSTEPSIPSMDMNRDSTRASNCHSENLTPAQISPSAEALSDPAEAATAVPYGHDRCLSAPSDPVEIERDAPKTALARSTTTATAEAPPSPMRRSTKRSALDAPEEEGVQTRSSKRGRVSAPTAKLTGVPHSSTGSLSRDSRTKTRVLRSRRVKGAVDTPGADPVTNPPGPSVTRPVRKARTAKKPVSSAAASSSKRNSSSSRGAAMDTGEETGRMRRGRQLTASSTSAPGESGPGGAENSLARSSTTRTRRSADSKTTKQDEPALGRHVPFSQSTGSVTGERQRGHVSTGAAGNSRLAASLPAPPKATVPVAFHFRSEARIDARRRPGGANGTAGRTEDAEMLGVPDFKTLHDAEEQRLASRREHIVPVLPGRVELSTEARAHEREKFEEGRRAREAEAERVLEERRRQQAAEEEREIRELRRRAVPKANEVPEWYAHAPRRVRDHTK